jgi:hypothetical protein
MDSLYRREKLLYVLQEVTVMEQKAIPADVLNVIPSEPARILLLEGETHLLNEPIVARIGLTQNT